MEKSPRLISVRLFFVTALKPAIVGLWQDCFASAPTHWPSTAVLAVAELLRHRKLDNAYSVVLTGTAARHKVTRLRPNKAFQAAGKLTLAFGPRGTHRSDDALVGAPDRGIRRLAPVGDSGDDRPR